MSRKDPKERTDMDKQVGERIRAARTAAGVSQSDIAKELGITFQMVQKYEKAISRMSVSRLVEVAELLGQPINFFTDPPNADFRRMVKEGCEP